MLKNLSLNNFLLTKHTNLNLEDGVCVLTGETGAGKSILINALSLTIGSRGSSSWVKKGQKQTTISAHFSPLSEGLKKQLEKLAIDYENDEITLRRVLFSDGKSKSFVNDTAVTLKTLQTIGLYLVDIYGQHSHYALLKSEIQREKLDQSGNYQNLLTELKINYGQWQLVSKQLQQLLKKDQTSQDRFNLLSYQLQEFEHLELFDNEFKELEQKQSQLSQADSINQSTSEAVNLLYETEQSAISTIESLQNKLEAFIPDFSDLAGVCQTLNEAGINLHEAVTSLKSITVAADPELLNQTETRISLLFDLARKHQCQPNQLVTTQQTLQQELDSINSNNEDTARLELEKSQLWGQLEKTSSAISLKRKETAQKLAKKISTQIQSLGMSGASLKIKLIPLKDNNINQYGKETIQFELETNPGLGFNKLNNSASGGELSRLGLAVQVCSMKGPHTPTIIMDEVDAGIGGETANKVGTLLSELSKKSQILCVTHLPQIACIAKQHIKVTKEVSQDDTQHAIQTLDHEQRTKEIARMLDGDSLSEESLLHAKTLLAKA